MVMQDILKRYEQLNNWTSGTITTPNSVWLPGLFNPKVRHLKLSLVTLKIFCHAEDERPYICQQSS